MNDEETVITDLGIENTNPDGKDGEPIPPTPSEEGAPEDDSRILAA